jgi:hypothetical protein
MINLQCRSDDGLDPPVGTINSLLEDVATEREQKTA